MAACPNGGVRAPLGSSGSFSFRRVDPATACGKKMKRKIILGLLLHTAACLVAGLYLTVTIGSATERVNGVIRLHQVELLRRDFLLRVKAVQADLDHAAAGRSRMAGVIDQDVTQLGAAVDSCFGCHHSDESTARLTALKSQTERYRQALAAVPPDGGAEQSEVAFGIGEDLVGQVRDIIDVTNARLQQRTLSALGDIARTRYVVYGMVLLGPLLSVLLGLVAVTGLTRPLDALVEATRRLKAGHLDHRVEGLRDEFKELSESFNEMASSLKDQMQLMQRTEQLVVVGELAAGLVHEIKNPLAGIKAATQVLSQEASLSEEDREVLRKVSREVVGLQSLLKAFLEFAKPVKPQLTDVDLNGFVESVAAFYLRSHHAGPHPCPVRIAKALGPIPPARVDPMQLQQMLLNLLLNAVDAMPNGGAVEVRTGFDHRSRQVHIEVADRGRGISPLHAEHIFRPFFTTKPGGTGLGLAVSKRLAEQHGGSISFTANPSGGTIFRIELPSGASPSDMAQIA
jgi:signal transduction histidine kinase